jgi:hypothetical protein
VEKIFPSKSHLFFILFLKIGMHRSTENFRKVSKGFLGLKPLESSLEGNFIMREGEANLLITQAQFLIMRLEGQTDRD